MSRLLPPLLACMAAGCTCACGPDRATAKNCGGGVYLLDHAASCDAALEHVATARRIVSAAGLETPDVDVIFVGADEFDSPCGRVDGCTGLGWVMVDARGGSVAHELVHVARGPGHFAWGTAGWLGLDHFGHFLATGELATVADLCTWEVPKPTQVDQLRDAGLPVDAWIERLRQAQRARGCDGVGE